MIGHHVLFPCVGKTGALKRGSTSSFSQLSIGFALFEVKNLSYIVHPRQSRHFDCVFHSLTIAG
jgi:hypothetical protein